MFTTSRPKSTALFAILAVVALAAAAAAGAPAVGRGAPLAAAPVTALSADEAISQIEGEDGVLRFDVAENATNFAWAGDPELTDGFPTGRTAYLTQGYIYPAGTLSEGNGVNPDGSPEFPELVLGQWSCWGWYLGTEAPAGQARWITSHLFSFGDAWGEATVVSEGYSIDDLEVALERAVVGGTGPYAGARGVQLETNLGFNASNGVNVRYEIDLTAR